MSKFLKYVLLTFVIIAVIFGVLYVYNSYLFEKTKTEMISRAEQSEFEIIKIDKNEETNKALFFIYYPKENPTIDDIKDLAVYLTFEKSHKIKYIAVTVCDDKDATIFLAQDPSSMDFTKDEESKNRWKGAISKMIVMWDSLNWITNAGENYQYLDSINLEK